MAIYDTTDEFILATDKAFYRYNTSLDADAISIFICDTFNLKASIRSDLGYMYCRYVECRNPIHGMRYDCFKRCTIVFTMDSIWHVDKDIPNVIYLICPYRLVKSIFRLMYILSTNKCMSDHFGIFKNCKRLIYDSYKNILLCRINRTIAVVGKPATIWHIRSRHWQH